MRVKFVVYKLQVRRPRPTLPLYMFPAIFFCNFVNSSAMICRRILALHVSSRLPYSSFDKVTPIARRNLFLFHGVPWPRYSVTLSGVADSSAKASPMAWISCRSSCAAAALSTASEPWPPVATPKPLVTSTKMFPSTSRTAAPTAGDENRPKISSPLVILPSGPAAKSHRKQGVHYQNCRCVRQSAENTETHRTKN